MKKFICFIIFMTILLPVLPLQSRSIRPQKGVTLTFVGDIMANAVLVDTISRDTQALEPIRPFLVGNLNFANLEFTVNTNKPAEGYPNFNGTREYLRYFTKFFNLFSVANNHVYDQGARSQVETLSFLEEDNILFIGGNTQHRHTPPLITNINGIDLLITAYSMVDNGLYVRSTNSSARYYMNFHPNISNLTAAVHQDMQSVPKSTLKIVSLHFGNEYTSIPNTIETNIPQQLIEAGADIIIGHHPHVPRPAVWYEGTNHSGVILYSLGNFYTPHKNSYLYLDAGTIVRLNVFPKKRYQFSYTPTFTYFFDDQSGRRSRVLPLLEDPDKTPPTGYTYTARDKINMKAAYNIVHEFYSPLREIIIGK
ncbi:MAG: CapA family protein [Brevinema sp.]